MMGPAEKSVRDSLAARPAGQLEALDGKAADTFAAMFNGCRTRCWITPNGELFAGKAECEWGWPHDWDTLKAAALIDYAITEEANHVKVGGVTRYVNLGITPLGWSIREDDLVYFHELMAAMDRDRPLVSRETAKVSR